MGWTSDKKTKSTSVPEVHYKGKKIRRFSAPLWAKEMSKDMQLLCFTDNSKKKIWIFSSYFIITAGEHTVCKKVLFSVKRTRGLFFLSQRQRGQRCRLLQACLELVINCWVSGTSMFQSPVTLKYISSKKELYISTDEDSEVHLFK